MRSAVAVLTGLPIQSREQLTEREALDCEILFLLEGEPEITQRELARRVGVSLGRANYCLRALAARGALTLEYTSALRRKGRCIYVLTPQGLAERNSLSDQFLTRKRAQFNDLKLQIALIERDVAMRESSCGHVLDPNSRHKVDGAGA